MTLLYAGLALWIVVHLVPGTVPALRSRLQGALGPRRYKAIFAVLVLTGLAMIVAGWRSAAPDVVYVPPAWGRNVTFILMFVSVLLFGAANAPSNVKQVLRHPMLIGLIVWSLGHLLSNGDSRSVALFGALGLWATVEIPLINRREGLWLKPARVPLRSDLITIAISAVVFFVLILLHPYFAGVRPMLVS